MTSKSHSPTPFSRLSRISIFKSPSPSSRNRTGRKSNAKEDNWYIPYNGPYEAPRQPYVKPKERDSWGDSVYGDDDYDNDEKDAPRPSESSNAWCNTDDAGERVGRPRSKTMSALTSSGSADVNRSGLRQRQPLPPSYINVDASGGVGESPSPRTSRDTPAIKRSSFANIFALVSSNKRPGHSVKPLRVNSRTPLGREAKASSTPSTDDEEYYHSYYSSLVHSPLRNQFHIDNQHRSSGEPPSSHIIDRPATTSPTSHPYAYTHTDEDERHPHTAPLVSTNSNDSDPFRAVAMQPSQSTGVSLFLHPGRSLQSLKNSNSSPDLRNTRRSPTKPLSVLKGKDRWLSPETWCDALFLPRPRFKVKRDGSVNYGNRIVSPPGSPVVTSFREADAVSRVLAHSRSMVELQARPDPGPSTYVPPPLPVTFSERPPRPKSFAWDDLALPSPVPSLSRVLEEGQILEHQRKKWQTQAVNSFQNSRTRNLSRTRAKSLTKADRRKEVKHSHMDFLAARSFVGNQNPIPIITRSATDSKHTASRSSHTHSNSLSKTLSTTKTHSRTHSKSDSWSKSAMRLANGVLCNGNEVSPTEEKRGFEDALNADGTKVIHFEDPSTARIDPALLSRNTPSQASNSTDMRVGIALSTPPVDDRESIHLPSHPYAQGGMYTYISPTSQTIRSPIPRAPSREEEAPELVFLPAPRVESHPYALYADREPAPSQSPRHLSPTKLYTPPVEQEVPNESKMWAQVGDGELREVRPDDIKYSPYMAAPDTPPRQPQTRNSGNIYDMVGVAEALANAVRSRESKDSGFGSSEEHPYSSHRQPVEYDATQPLHRRRVEGHEQRASPKSSPAKFIPHIDLPSSPLLRPTLTKNSSSDDSRDRTPDTPSSHSPRPLGNVDDLENYHDLFYRPVLERKASTRSTLTNLARQLSQEFEQLSDRHVSNGTRFSAGSGSDRSSGRDGPIHFVLSDDHPSRESVLSQRGILPFHPSIAIPEDVESSSMLERSPDEENDEPFRFGEVEQLHTPPAVSSTHRASFIGQFVSGRQHVTFDDNEDNTITHDRPRTASLQPPSADPSRTSYATNSTYSRMSNLSDFPVPPPINPDTPGHMSFVSSYFEPQDPHHHPAERRLTFGGDAEIDELLDHLNHGR